MIINSVIAGKGGGDEVEAYALGDAKNAVKDDKVTLNFSAGILPIEESVAVSSSTDYFFTGYAKNTEAVFLSGSYAYVFKKNPDGVWSKTSTTSFGSSGANKRCSPFGLLIDLYAGTGFKVINGYLASLDYSIAGRSYEPRDRALFSTTGEYCAVFSNTGSGYKTVVYYKNSLLQVLNEWSGASYDSVPRFFFANKDGVEYLFIGNTTTLGKVQTPHTYRLTSAGAEYLGKFSVSRQDGDYVYTYATASIGDLLITSSSDDNTTLSNIGMFKTEIDLTQKTVVLKNAAKELTSFKNILKFPEGDALNLVPTGDANIIQYRSGCVKYNPNEGTFEPYLPTGVTSDRVFYNADERVAVKIIDNTTKFNLYRLLQPVEQPYVATSFADRSYCFSSGLTGIVKENNNGVLKVSTVEDPNNLPPTIPDEAGLKTTINYGGDYVPNGTTVRGVSKDAEGGYTMVAGTSYVYTPNPLYNKDYSSFEIVMPLKTTNSSVQHLINFGNLCLLVYKGSTTSLRFRLRPASASNYTDYPSTVDLTKKYWVKLTYDSSSGYTLLGSSDGVSYTTLITVSNTEKPYSMIENLDFSEQTTTLYFDEAYMNVDGVRVWEGTKINFGSVGVGYGYFLNPQYKRPDWWSTVGKTKYLSYDGGLLTEDDIYGRKATTMNIILSRNADMGSWTSDTEGYLSTQDAVVMGVNKKLSTPVYLWHDLSYITPAVPETIEPEVIVRKNNAQVLQNFTTTGVTVDEQANITGFNSGAKYMAYIDSPLYNKEVSRINWWFSFTTGTSVTTYDRTICGFYNSVSSGDVNGFFLKTNPNGQVCFGNGTSSATYLATGSTTLSASTRYNVNIAYSTSTGYTVIVRNGSDGSVVENLTASTTAITTAPYLVFGCNVAAGSTNYNWNGLIELASYYITVDGTTTYFAVPFTGTVSLPSSWKTLDGVIYEYPNGFPETQASDLEVNIVEGFNNLYATRTGDTCGLAISSTSPAGVDSSAVIGTVELDANGAITSYTPGE